MSMSLGFDYNIDDLYEEAKKRWLKPIEVLYILRNHEHCKFTNVPPHQPESGSLFLFNKRIMRFFRKDGHNWRKKKDGRSVGEAHERLKVGNVEILNCYYAHGEEKRTFQRRSYWMLDPAYEHIVIVHYRETSEGTSSSGPVTQMSPGNSSMFSRSGSSYTKNPGTAAVLGDSCEPIQNFCSPGSVEVTSDIFIKNNGSDHLDTSDIFIRNNGIDQLDGTDAQALRRLEEQLSLNEDSIDDVYPSNHEHEIAHDLNPRHDQRVICEQANFASFTGPHDCVQPYHEYNRRQDGSGKYHGEAELINHDCPDGNEKALSWKQLLESCKPPCISELPEQHAYETSGKDGSLYSSGRVLIANQEDSAENSIDRDKFPPYSLVQTQGTNSDYALLFEQIQMQKPLGADSCLAVSQNQKFTIRAVSPEWCYSTETTKVFIIGTFLCLPLDSTWACMFGDIEVPAEIIQDCVICCEAPAQLPGKVTLCITSGNQESCSEVREFEFRDKNNDCTHSNSLKTGTARNPEELLLLVRFSQMLLSASTTKNGNIESVYHLPTIQKEDEDSWSRIIEALLVGSGTSSGIVDWIVEELLKDKLQQWLSHKSQERDEKTGCSLTKQEQGIIHMVAGLGFEWALNPILSYGVNVNFRDINGWTALHWAARFGREKMVASLIASGASAGAVTDPSSKDPAGKTAASIAAISGHKGLAGYLSEVDLTSHLLSLTLEESEISKGSAELLADYNISRVCTENIGAGDDRVSLEDTLAAVKNAALAAGRIQAAFRAHSFKKWLEREAAAAAARLDGSGISADSIVNIPELSSASKLIFGRSCDYNSAALSIQKKYRGWKGRKDFLALRQKVVKIQAHVRGYQVRKQYKFILWAVGIWEKVVLRWRRKGAGLRGFRPESQPIDESDDEDFLKVFRKQKVHVAVEKAFSRVLSMVHSSGARQQYRRMLEMYREAKVNGIKTKEAELCSTIEGAPSTSGGDASITENDEFFRTPLEWEML